MKLKSIVGGILYVLCCQNVNASGQSIGSILTSYDEQHRSDLLQGPWRSSYLIPCDAGFVEVSFMLDETQMTTPTTNDIPSSNIEFLTHWIEAFGVRFRDHDALRKAEEIVATLETKTEIYPPRHYTDEEHAAISMLNIAKREKLRYTNEFLREELEAFQQGTVQRELTYYITSQRTTTRCFQIFVRSTNKRLREEDASEFKEEPKQKLAHVASLNSGCDKEEENREQASLLFEIVSPKPEHDGLKHMSQFQSFEDFSDFIMQLMQRALNDWVDKAQHDHKTMIDPQLNLFH